MSNNRRDSEFFQTGKAGASGAGKRGDYDSLGSQSQYNKQEADQLKEQHRRKQEGVSTPSGLHASFIAKSPRNHAKTASVLTGDGKGGDTNLGEFTRGGSRMDDIREDENSGNGETTYYDRTRQDGSRTAAKKRGGGQSAERLRKVDADAYEDRIDQLHHNIAHYDHHGDAKIKKKALNNAKNTGMTTKALFPDRLECLKDENIRKKNNLKELESKIKVISNKFQRQTNLLKKQRMIGMTGQRSAVTKQFENDFNELIEENSKLQMQEMELMDKVKKINNKRKKELAQGKTLYSTVERGMDKTARAEAEGAKVLQSLKQTLQQTEGRVISLHKEIENTKRMANSTLKLDELQRERRETELKLMRAQAQKKDMEARIKSTSNIFDMSKDREQSLFDELKREQAITNELVMKKSTLEATSRESEDIRLRLNEAKQQETQLKTKLDQILEQPFFKKQQDDQGLRALKDLEHKIEDTERNINDSKKTILKTTENLQTVKDRIKQLTKTKNKYEDEITKMNAHMDPTSLTLNDVMKKLRNEDPNSFRQVMDDLQYDGRDPAWLKMGYEDQLSHLVGRDDALNEDSLDNLTEKRDKLKRESFELVTELKRVQELLKLNVDMDKQNAARQQAELDIIQSRIKQQTLRSNELTHLVKTQNQKLLTMQNQQDRSRLTVEELKRFEHEVAQLKTENKQVDGQDADAMSEVTARTDETELGPQENLLDIKIMQASFKRIELTQILMDGHQEIDQNTMQTFLAVDFYNHDTQSTDSTIGIEPMYNTLFSFKNTVDDFYIKYLERDTILIDIFYIPKVAHAEQGAAKGAFKLGSAKLPLNKLLDKDHSMQAQEIIYTAENGVQRDIGKIFFMMRPRKSLDEAIKWYKQKQTVKQRQIDFDAPKKHQVTDQDEEKKSQIIEIEVKAARDLRISGQNNEYSRSQMEPFFTYDFYTFTHSSAIVYGPDPRFDDTKRFQVEQTNEFINYMKMSFLKIDFIDESCKSLQNGVRDYIGSARIPLQQLLSQQEIQGNFELRDEYESVTGKVTVKLTIHNNQRQAMINMGRDATGLMQHRRIHHDTIQKIVDCFAQGDFEEIEMYFNMLFMKDNSNMQRVTREMFVDFILVDMRVADNNDLNKHDLDIFLSTHEQLAGKALFTMQELKSIFEHPFKEARLAAARKEAAAPNRSLQFYNYSQVDNPLKTRAFGNSIDSKRPHKDTMPFNKAGTMGADDFNEREQAAQGNDRQTFGHPQPDDVRFTQKMDDIKSNTIGRGEQNGDLGQLLQKEFSDLIHDFSIKTQADMHGVEQQQFLDIMRNFLGKHRQKVVEDELIKYFQQNQVNDLFFYRETLLQKYGKALKIPNAMAQRSPQQIQNVNAIKKELEKFLIRKDYTLSEFYRIIDKNDDQSLSFKEFVSSVGSFLTEEFAVKLFKAIDHNNTKELSKDEFHMELASVQASFYLKKIKTRAKESNLTAETFFDTYDDNQDGVLDRAEFQELIAQTMSETDRASIDFIFRTIDNENLGHITRANFIKIFNDEADSVLYKRNSMESMFQAEDVVKPLATAIKRLRLGISETFEKFKNPSVADSMPYANFYELISYFLGISLDQQEQITLTHYLNAFGAQRVRGFQGNALTRSLFEQILASVRTQNLYRKDAKDTITKVKRCCTHKGVMIVSEIDKYQSSQEKLSKEINIRSLKYFVYAIANMQSYEVDNLVKYLDTDNDGFVSVVDLQSNLGTVSRGY